MRTSQNILVQQFHLGCLKVLPFSHLYSPHLTITYSNCQSHLKENGYTSKSPRPSFLISSKLPKRFLFENFAVIKTSYVPEKKMCYPWFTTLSFSCICPISSVHIIININGVLEVYPFYCFVVVSSLACSFVTQLVVFYSFHLLFSYLYSPSLPNPFMHLNICLHLRTLLTPFVFPSTLNTSGTNLLSFTVFVL